MGQVSAAPARLGTGWEAGILTLITAILILFGLVAIYSASMVMTGRLGVAAHYFMLRQTVAAAIGFAGLITLARLDYQRLRGLAWPMFLATAGLLLIVLLPWTESIAPTVNGARRWLRIAGLQFQPSELAKLVVVIWTASVATKKQDQFDHFGRGLAPILVGWAALAALILLGPDLSTTVVVLSLGGAVVFAAGARLRHLAALALAALPLLWFKVSSASYQMDRLLAFREPGADAAGYQAHQALIALGSGGLIGRGFGKGQQKHGFLPEPHNDFLFAMIGEEWGFVGLVMVMALFAAFAMVGMRIAKRAPDLFGYLIATGATALILVQALMHISVNLALVPTTGIALPLLSYGGSSLVVNLLSVGLLLSVARAGQVGVAGR